jgi:hypothetical protein
MFFGVQTPLTRIPFTYPSDIAWRGGNWYASCYAARWSVQRNLNRSFGLARQLLSTFAKCAERWETILSWNLSFTGASLYSSIT